MRYPCLEDEIAEPCIDMNIKVTPLQRAKSSIIFKLQRCILDKSGNSVYPDLQKQVDLDLQWFHKD